MNKKPTTVDQCIGSFPPDVQVRLRELQAVLRKAVPNATEAIKWGVPVFEADRILFAFAAFKSHVNFMPTAPAMKPFEKELAAYKTGKDTIQFPYDKPLPRALITRIAKHRVKDVKENDAKWRY